MEEKERTSTLSADLPARISARIIDEANGMTELKEVQAIRIKNNRGNVLIMADYMPALGRVHGDVSFLMKEREISCNNIRGFYKHRKNEFTLLIENEKDGWYKKI